MTCGPLQLSFAPLAQTFSYATVPPYMQHHELKLDSNKVNSTVEGHRLGQLPVPSMPWRLCTNLCFSCLILIITKSTQLNNNSLQWIIRNLDWCSNWSALWQNSSTPRITRSVFLVWRVALSDNLQVLPIVVYFSSFISVMYYLGAMQWLIFKIAWLMEVSLGTSATETMVAAGLSCVFIYNKMLFSNYRIVCCCALKSLHCFAVKTHCFQSRT